MGPQKPSEFYGPTSTPFEDNGGLSRLNIEDNQEASSIRGRNLDSRTPIWQHDRAWVRGPARVARSTWLRLMPPHSEKDGQPNGHDYPGAELHRSLSEAHISNMGFNSVVGVGLFLSSGRVIAIAGPGLGLIAYVLVGSLMWCVMGCLEEMTAAHPVRGATFEFVARFTSDFIGFVCASMSWWQSSIFVAAEAIAVAELFSFQVDQKYLEQVQYPQLTEWPTKDVPRAIWVILVLMFAYALNMLPVRLFGILQTFFGRIKILLLVTIILTNTILSARRKFHDDNFWTYQAPWGFATDEFVARTLPPTNTTSGDVVYYGSGATVASLWTAVITAFPSILGWDIMMLAAPEIGDWRGGESLQLASRKTTLRILILYLLAVFTVGLNVPYTDEGLQTTSIFVLAAIREHVLKIPHILNAFFIFSATVTSANYLYTASRLLCHLSKVLHVLPLDGDTRYSIAHHLQRTTKFGVPWLAVTASLATSLVAFMVVNPTSDQALRRMISAAVTCTLIVYGLNCLAYLRYRKWRNNVDERNDEMDQNVDLRRLILINIYDSGLQPAKAWYGMLFCALLVVSKGWLSIVSPMNVNGFLASYLPVFIFLAATIFWRPWVRGNERRRQEGLRFIAERDSLLPRMGVLKFPAWDGLQGGKAIWTRVKIFLSWLWVWMR